MVSKALNTGLRGFEVRWLYSSHTFVPIRTSRDTLNTSTHAWHN